MEQVKTKKKRSSPQMEHFFSPNSSRDLRSDAHQSQIIGRDADDSVGKTRVRVRTRGHFLRTRTRALETRTQTRTRGI